MQDKGKGVCAPARVCACGRDKWPCLAAAHSREFADVDWPHATHAHVRWPAGKDVYVDVAGWHLYLRDMNAAPGLKMCQVS